MAADETLAALEAGRAIVVPAGATSAEVATLLGIGEKKVRAAASVRKRKAAVPAAAAKPVGPHVVLHQDRPVMSVPLVGEIGAGKRFLVDLLTFDRMKLFVGEEWTLIQPSGAGNTAYVASRRLKVQKAMGEDHGTGSCVRLARWITRAPVGSVVTYRDGSPLNLTRRNLAVVDRLDHWDAHRARTSRAKT